MQDTSSPKIHAGRVRVQKDEMIEFNWVLDREEHVPSEDEEGRR